MADEPLVVAEVADGVGIARLNRPEARNALSPELMSELAELLEAWDADPAIGCIVIAGSDEWFAAGADIKAMRDRSFQEALVTPTAAFWPRLAALRTPMIAAVSGYALGGGCELALVCDMIVASETAEFGQPEIMLGIIPGGGGSQRLARVIGKQRAMELVLTGRRVERRGGQPARVREHGREEEGMAREGDRAGAGGRPPAARSRCGSASRRCLPRTRCRSPGGLDHERRLYEIAMATEDRVEGMSAFIEKRKPKFRGR